MGEYIYVCTPFIEMCWEDCVVVPVPVQLHADQAVRRRKQSAVADLVAELLVTMSKSRRGFRLTLRVSQVVLSLVCAGLR